MANVKVAGKMDQVRQLVLRNVEAVNNHDLDAMVDTAVTDLEVVGPDGSYRGRDRFLEELGTLIKAFPDYQFLMGDLIVEGTKLLTLRASRALIWGPIKPLTAERCRPLGNESSYRWSTCVTCGAARSSSL